MPADLPNAEQVEQHLRRNAIKLKPATRALMPLITLMIVSLFAFALHPILGTVFLVFALVGLLLYTSIKARIKSSLEKEVQTLNEIAVCRYHDVALRKAWQLLPKLTQMPAQQVQAVAVIGSTLDILGEYEGAIVAYDYVLEIGSDDPEADEEDLTFADLHSHAQRQMVAMELQGEEDILTPIFLQRNMLALLTDRLSEADDMLRQLSDAARSAPDSVISGAFHLLELLQMVKTYRYQDAVEMKAQPESYQVTPSNEAFDWLAALRPLGCDAAWGHALLAFCFSKVGDHASAMHWWNRATLLMPAGDLQKRFPDLAGYTPTRSIVQSTHRNSLGGTN